MYCIMVLCVSLFMIFKVVPAYGTKNPFVYISICSLVGSVSVMAIKAFGIALKLTFAGNNQFTHPSTYAFALIVAICIVVQMNYFNKALEQFSTNVYVYIGMMQNVQFSCHTFSQCQSHLLCLFHNGYNHCFSHLVSGLQHRQSHQRSFLDLWIYHYFHRRLFIGFDR